MPRSIFLLEIGGIIFGLAMLARLATKVGLSPIPLYLVAGLAFGEGGIVPLVTAEGFIEIGAEIGVILLLFMLGLEYTANELSSNLRSSALSGSVDVGLNFLPGVIAGYILDLPAIGIILLGGITYMSSSGVIAKLIGDLGWMANRETPAVLSLLVIEDLLMAAYLPLIAVLLVGGDPIESVIAIAVAILVVVVVLTIAFKWGDFLSRVVFSESDEVLLLSIFGITLVVAGVTESLQVSAAVGAFLVGIGLSGAAAARARSLLTPLRDLFAASFFLFFGFGIDPRALKVVLGPALALGLVTAVTKFITGSFAASRLGVGAHGRARAGAVFVARGEFSIAIAAIGISGGLSHEFGALAAAYVLFLAVLGPLLSRNSNMFVGLVSKSASLRDRSSTSSD